MLGRVYLIYLIRNLGVPQGAILSVTLFILKIKSIIKCLPVGVRGSLYVDDFVFVSAQKV